MLRLKILASSIPLILAAALARGEWSPVDQPCITIGETSVQIATAPWQAQSHVVFTDDPARATVRVQILDAPDGADLAIVDDPGSVADGSCGATVATQMIGIGKDASVAGPVIYLSREPNADVRIFVRSKTVSPSAAAALIVGARGAHSRMAAATL